MLFVLGGCAFVLGLIIAHVLGARFARRLDVRPGHARRVMPTLPLAQFAVGPEWTRGLRRVERTLLPILQVEPTGVEAAPLAGRLEEPLDLVVAVLERLREEVPCRLRVTRSGRLLHDFEPAALAELAVQRRQTRPWLAAVYLFGLFANLGAAWPVIIILFVASSTLVEVFRDLASGVRAGVGGLVALAALIGLTLVLGALMSLILRPRGGPRLGAAPVSEVPRARFRGGFSLAAFFQPQSDTVRRRRRSWSSSSSSSNSSRGDGAAQAIIIAVLLAIIAAAFSVLVVWARGIWRAIRGRVEEEGITPSAWVRGEERVDLLERFVPTSDLVGRISRTLRRAVARRRPTDADLGPRILVRAARRGGMVTGLEIALAEGLDLAEAIEAGTRLCTALDGRILALEGEVVFSFPPAVLSQVEADEDPDLWAEFLTFDQRGPHLRRKPEQEVATVPVNLVGLRAAHLEAASRLATGAWLMAATGVVFLLADVPPNWNRFTFDLPAALHGLGLGPRIALAGLLGLFAIATTTLATAAGYAAQTEAILGMRRDARRAAFQEIVEICRQSDAAVVDLQDQATRLQAELEWAWPAVDRALFSKEMIGVAADLDLEPAPAAGSWAIGALRARIARAEAIEAPPIGAPVPADDPVIFDTRVELDRITALI